MPNIIINGGSISLSPSIGTGSSGASATDSKSIVLKTKDTYVTEDIQVNVSATAAASATLGTFANSVASGTENSYTENTSNDTIIPADGYLYMSGGWYEKQKISLGHLIPDIAQNDAGEAHIRTGFKAYDEDGSLITGTMNDITPVFDGGAVTTTASLSYTAPSGNIKAEGTLIPGSGLTDLGDDYGVTTIQPTGTDGSDYLSIDAVLTNTTNGSAQATSTANRGNVLYNGNYAGYLDIADDTVALAAPQNNATDSSAVTTINLTNLITDNFPRYYIPIVTPTASGAALPDGTITITTTSVGNYTATPSVGVYGFDNGGNQSSTDCGTDFGITTTAPTTNQQNWVALDPAVSCDDIDVSATITVQPGNISLNCGPGITSGVSTTSAISPKTYSGSTQIDMVEASGTTRYVKVTHPEATAICAVSNPSVTTTTSASMAGGTGHPVNVPSAATPTTTAPADLSTYTAGYIVISPGTSASSTGTATANATATTTKGLVKDETVNATQDTETITTQINNTDGAKAYIKIWNMGYNVDNDNTTYYGQLGSQ